jgi:hypothetical protein
MCRTRYERVRTLLGTKLSRSASPHSVSGDSLSHAEALALTKFLDVCKRKLVLGRSAHVRERGAWQIRPRSRTWCVADQPTFANVVLGRSAYLRERGAWQIGLPSRTWCLANSSTLLSGDVLWLSIVLTKIGFWFVHFICSLRTVITTVRDSPV